MGLAGSDPEFYVNSGSGRVGSLYLWVGLGQVQKIGPTFNFELCFCNAVTTQSCALTASTYTAICVDPWPSKMSLLAIGHVRYNCLLCSLAIFSLDVLCSSDHQLSRADRCMAVSKVPSYRRPNYRSRRLVASFWTMVFGCSVWF